MKPIDLRSAVILQRQTNIAKFDGIRNQTSGQINQYKVLISQCEIRDRELAKAKSEREKKGIKKKYPPYDIKAMEEQIEQFRESIARFDKAIDKEHQSIAEITERIVMCRQRDKELRRLGVKV